MKNIFSFPFLFFLLLPLTVVSKSPFPLSTDSRYIVDPTGARVKLACVNWPSHLQPMVAEGLGKEPMDKIAGKIRSMGFNCVRLTWALFMMTNDTLGNTKVVDSFMGLGLNESAAGIQVNNPEIYNLTVVDAYKTVVACLGKHSIMAILDNQISTPGWCCSSTDGNGFFGDQYFDPNIWLEGLTRVATMFNGTTTVVGMSLRNELRGPKQNVNDWRKYMQMGAEAVHKANPNILVILSGLYSDNDLSFLSSQQVNVSFTKKLVFELHWYSFSDSPTWTNTNPSDACRIITYNVRQKAAFVLEQGFPLFVSEWGYDQRGNDTNDNSYIGCYVALAAELDWDWALWALQGSYYLREGVLGLDEVYGVLDWDWHRIRNSTYLNLVKTLQPPFQGPGLSDRPAYIILLHTISGKCVVSKGVLGLLALGPCNESVPWVYTDQKLSPVGAFSCLSAHGVGEPATLEFFCLDSEEMLWETSSPSSLQIATNLTTSNSTVCLDVAADGSGIVTNECMCLSGDVKCEPMMQWFKMVNTTRSVF